MNLTKMLFDLRTTLPSPWGDRMWIVEPGEFYRSRLLDPREIEQVRDEYGTNSVISLLGKYPNPDWLDREIETCERLGMGFHNLKVETPRDFNDMGKIENLIGIYNEFPSSTSVFSRTGLSGKRKGSFPLNTGTSGNSPLSTMNTGNCWGE